MCTFSDLGMHMVFLLVEVPDSSKCIQNFNFVAYFSYSPIFKQKEKPQKKKKEKKRNREIEKENRSPPDLLVQCHFFCMSSGCLL